MSTDYGFQCVDCSVGGRVESYIVNNARSNTVDLLKAILANLPLIKQINAIPDLQVKHEWSSDDWTPAIEFAIAHVDRGHKVVPADEYGRAWDQCSERATCLMCGHSEPCVLTEKHDGEHDSRKARR